MAFFSCDHVQQIRDDHGTNGINPPKPSAGPVLGNGSSEQAGSRSCTFNERAQTWIIETGTPINRGTKCHIIVTRRCPLWPWEWQQPAASQLVGLDSESSSRDTCRSRLGQCVLGRTSEICRKFFGTHAEYDEIDAETV